MNQWHATLTNAFGDQLTEPVGVLGGGSHDVTAITVTTYDSAYRYVNEYGDRSACSSSTRNTTCQPRPTGRSPR